MRWCSQAGCADRGGGQGGDGDEADVGCARGQTGGALGRQHSINLIAKGELSVERGMLEVPHEGRGVEEADAGNAQTGWGTGTHVLLDYRHGANNAGGVCGMNLGRQWLRLDFF